MLQGNAALCAIAVEALLGAGSGVMERQDRFGGNDHAARIDNAQQRHRQGFRCGDPAGYRQVSAHEAVFAVEPLHDIFEESGRKGEFVERPSLDPEMDL